MKLRVVDGTALPFGSADGRGQAPAVDGTASREREPQGRWLFAARAVMVIAFAATVPTILGVRHGNRVFWTVGIAGLPFLWTTIGFHAWRRCCPLAACTRLASFVGRGGTRRMGAWMGRNYLVVQLAIMIACLSLRLVVTNGSATWLAVFLVAIASTAVATGFLYSGKTWCNFLCPLGVVERIHTEPAGSVVGRKLSSSRCVPCTACKKHCPDVDVAQSYWKELLAQPRRITYYAWPGVVLGFYVYFYLVAGTWAYYFTGVWTYERELPTHALDAGLFFAPQIPRLVAAPMTLVAFGAASVAVFWAIERGVLAIVTRRAASEPTRAPLAARVRHAMLAFTGMLAFDAFYCFAGQPSLRLLPVLAVRTWTAVVVLASMMIFVKRLGSVERLSRRSAPLRTVELDDEPRAGVGVLDPRATAHRFDLRLDDRQAQA
jgi:hypothetical protein